MRTAFSPKLGPVAVFLTAILCPIAGRCADLDWSAIPTLNAPGAPTDQLLIGQPTNGTFSFYRAPFSSYFASLGGVSGVTSFNTRTGTVTLSSGDIIAALGFTPYNASNPSGYETGSAVASLLTTAIPAATGQLLGGSGTSGTAAPITLGSGFSLSANTLTYSGGGYTLPQATVSTLGGVTVSTGLNVSAGALSVAYGTSAGTAAAGNDSRIVGALQASTAASTYVPVTAIPAVPTITPLTGTGSAGGVQSAGSNLVLPNGTAATTQTVGDNSNKVATDAGVQSALAGGPAGVASFDGRTGIVTLTSSDVTATGALATALPSVASTTPICGTGAAGATAACPSTAYVASVNGNSGAVTGIDTTALRAAAITSALPTGTTSQLYGPSGMAGAAQVITLGTNLSMSGTTLNATPSGVSAFNARTGNVTLTLADVTAVGGATATSVSAETSRATSAEASLVSASAVGANNGVAPLNSSGIVPAANLPSGPLTAVTALSSRLSVTSGTLDIVSQSPTPAGSVPPLSSMNILLSDGTYITGSQLQTLLASSGSGSTAPGQVTGLTAGTATSTTMPLTWTAPSTGTTPFTYTVNYRLHSASTWTTASASVSAVTYSVTGLTASTSYDFEVLATNSVGTGTASAVVTASTAAASSGPANTYQVQWYVSQPTTETFTATNAGDTYGSLTNSGAGYFELVPTAGGSPLSNSSSGVLAGWGLSSTTPPSAATVPSGFSGAYPANGYVTPTAANAPYFTDGEFQVYPTGSGAKTFYFWVSTDSGATWSVYRDTNNVAIGVTVTF